MGVLHETGHALYEAGLPKAWGHQPVGNARGMTLHESQSLLMEMQACRGCAFIDFAARRRCVPRFGQQRSRLGDREHLPDLYQGRAGLHPRRCRRGHLSATHRAALSPRTGDADVAISVRWQTCPGAWNDGMRELLGIVPPTDTLGCLQDIHWPDGAFGYFPTYTLGALAAAQLFTAARQVEPGLLDKSIGKRRRAAFTGLAASYCSMARAHSPPPTRYWPKRPVDRLASPPSRPIWKAAICRRKRDHARPAPQLRMLRQGPAQRRVRCPDLHLRVHLLRPDCAYPGFGWAVFARTAAAIW